MSIKNTAFTFRTPQYDRVISDTHPVELTKEDGDKTLFEKQTEELKHELNERKRCELCGLSIVE